MTQEQARNANHAAFLEALNDSGYGPFIRDDRDWRATKRIRGYITGLENVTNLEIIGTNGVLGLFVTDHGAFLGHIQHFSEKIEPLYSSAKQKRRTAKPRREPTKKQLELAKRVAVLEEL